MRQEDSRIDSEGNHMSGMKDSLEEDNVHLKTPLKVLSNRRGQKKSYPAKCHAMRIRNSKNRAVRSDQATDNVQGDSSMWRWNLEKELTKFIEKGVALNVNMNRINTISSVDGTVEIKLQNGIKDRWNLDVEVTKIIKTGVALGFYFNRREEEMAVILAKREVEDVRGAKIKLDGRRSLLEPEIAWTEMEELLVRQHSQRKELRSAIRCGKN
ncbi:hypothetical protein LWI28_008397 [Acer negundo]|uniref:Uncharacterized protein n=1 Tax=Acer negundo TaxID=4023 RepID=A0AAD5JH25_ACENE|nr:hypothetical protein LWI28_008397 [Acer negundo]